MNLDLKAGPPEQAAFNVERTRWLRIEEALRGCAPSGVACGLGLIVGTFLAAQWLPDTTVAANRWWLFAVCVMGLLVLITAGMAGQMARDAALQVARYQSVADERCPAILRYCARDPVCDDYRLAVVRQHRPLMGLEYEAMERRSALLDGEDRQRMAAVCAARIAVNSAQPLYTVAPAYGGS